MRIIYLFIDGIGFGSDNPEINPFSRYSNSFLSPLGQNKAAQIPEGLEIKQTDAHMGLEGLPQSATGQTSLWTGLNGPRAMGFHLTGFPGPTLINIIRQYSIIKTAVNHGHRATVLNAYSEKYHERIRKKPRLTSASTHVQLASGQPLKSMEDLENNEAMFMDITHEQMHRFFPDFKGRFPVKDPFERGQDLVRMSRNYELVVYEYFLTDKAGHNQSFEEAQYVIELLEEFLRGVKDLLNPEEELLLITSDHGNLEDLSTKSHTNNPVPTLALGKDAPLIHQEIKSLTDLVPFIYRRLGITFDQESAQADIDRLTAEKALAEEKRWRDKEKKGAAS